MTEKLDTINEHSVFNTVILDIVTMTENFLIENFKFCDCSVHLVKSHRKRIIVFLVYNKKYI